MTTNRPWKAGIDRHLAKTPAEKFRGWNERAGVRVLF